MKDLCLRYCFAVVFLVSAIVKTADFDGTSMYFMSITGMAIAQIKILLSILILVELCIAVCGIWGFYTSKNIYRMIKILLGFFLGVSGILSLMGVENCGCMGDKIVTTPQVSIIKNVLLIIMFNYMGRFKEKETDVRGAPV